MKKIMCLILAIFLWSAAAYAADSDGWKWAPNADGTISPVGNRGVAIAEDPITAVSGGTLPEYALKGRHIDNNGWSAAGDIVVPDTAYAWSCHVKATVATHTVSIDFALAGCNPVLDGVAIGADNEIDIPSGAVLYIEHRYENGAWVITARSIVGLCADGGADD